jgi:hypothetical protein
LLALATGAARAGDDWKPVTPAELALRTPSVEKDADAEIIFEEVRVDDSSPTEYALKHYVRVKIFTDRGRERYAKIDMVPDFGAKIKDVSGRVIKLDGSIIEIKKEDILERMIAKAGGEKLKARSFAVPSIEAGVIVEYRYSEIQPGGFNWMKLGLQRDLPVQTFSVYVKPNSYLGGMRAQQFKIPEAIKFVKDKDGFHRVTLTNIPAYRDEPRMPPLNSVRPWVMIYYTDEEDVKPDEYWKAYSKRRDSETKDLTKPNDDVKAAAADIAGGAATDEEKLAKFYEFCQNSISNVSFNTTMSPDERKKIKENNSPGDTLKRKVGTSGDVDLLFGALARAAGMEVHLAITGDRSEVRVGPNDINYRLFHIAAIAVKVGSDWRFFNPGLRFLPYGMLIWYEEGQDALILNSKEVIWAKVPLSSQEKSREKRTGTFKLLEDGTLEGDVHIEYTGQLSLSHKLVNLDDSVTKQEETLKDEIKERLSTAELSDIKIENANDPTKPFTYTFKIRVPGYAQRTGKRLFIQPGFFEHGTGALFTANERKYEVYFHYPWSEEDTVSIALPAGFTLDNAEQPASITPEMTQGIAAQMIRIGVSEDKKTLVYKRSFFFGGKGVLEFPTASYAQVKRLFDLIRQGDDHSIAMRQQ